MPVNLPNLITVGRLVLSAAVLGLLCAIDSGRVAHQRPLLQLAFWCFLAAVLGDALDGAIARRMGCVTAFGRFTDPLVDKILVCGVFVLFTGDAFWRGGLNVTGVAPWMVLVIVARELLVSALRASHESAKRDFGANWAGKLKMIIQSATIGVIFVYLGFDAAFLTPIVAPLVWATVVVTILSAVPYLARARALGARRPVVAVTPGARTVAPSARGEAA